MSWHFFCRGVSTLRGRCFWEGKNIMIIFFSPTGQIFDFLFWKEEGFLRHSEGVLTFRGALCESNFDYFSRDIYFALFFICGVSTFRGDRFWEGRIYVIFLSSRWLFSNFPFFWKREQFFFGITFFRRVSTLRGRGRLLCFFFFATREIVDFFNNGGSIFWHYFSSAETLFV